MKKLIYCGRRRTLGFIPGGPNACLSAPLLNTTRTEPFALALQVANPQVWKGLDAQAPVTERNTRTLAGRMLPSELLADAPTLGLAIRRMRIHISQQSQNDFAKACRVSRRTLCEIELDRGNPTIRSFERILSVFGLTIGIAPSNTL